MRKTLLYCIMACIIASFSMCDEKEEVVPFLKLDESATDFKASASSKELPLQSNLLSYDVVIGESGKDWCTARVINNNGNKLQVNVLENTKREIREAEVTIKSGNLTVPLKVRQLGTDAAILVAPDIFSLTALSETIQFTVTTNVEITIETPEWIQEAPAVRSAEMVETLHTYIVARNTDAGKRTGEILIKETGGTKTATVIVSQKGMDDYNNDNTGDIKDDIKLTISGAEASSHQGGGEIAKSFDGDMNTLYHSNWSNAGTNYFPITVTYRFENQESLDYLFYYPRTSGSNGNFKETEIWISTEAEPTMKKIADKDFKGSGSATRVTFDQTIIKPTAVQFVIKSGAGDGQGFASCAEMEFYRKNPDNFDPLTLFTDITCSELKPSITAKEIDECKYPFYQSIAYYMLEGKYPSEFRIQGYKAYPHPDMQASTNKTSPYSLLDNPTGVAAEQGKELIIFVGDTHGETLSLKIQNLDYPGGDGYYNGSSSYPLSTGVNKIKPTNSGLLYVLFHTKNYQSVDPVKIHIATGTVNGYFDVKKHTAQQWQTLLSKASNKYFDVLGEYAHLTFPTDRFRKNTPDGKALVDVYDKIALSEQEFMGLKKYDKMFKNRMYFHVIYTSYMYATSYRTAYHDGTLDEIANANKLKTDAIWGPAHEVGHMNQTRPGLKWIGTTEVTNNIYSQYIQTSFGNASRLQSENMNPYNNRYEKAMNNSFLTEPAHCLEGDVFCKLVPFWQLYLYTAKVMGNDEFYKDLLERIRTSPNKTTNGAHQLNYVRMSCEITGLNLLEFFEKWGFLTPVNTTIEDYATEKMEITQANVDALKAEINAHNYPLPPAPLWYITDNSVNAFKESYSKGTATKSGNTFMMSNYRGVVGYEVETDGKTVFVSPASKFTLVNTTSNSTTKVFAITSNGSKEEVTF